MTRSVVTTESLSPPVGPFSPAVLAREFIFVSGQVALDPATATLIEGDVVAQAERVFENLRVLLHAAGKSFADVVKVGVFLTDMKDFAALNAVYGRHFEAPYPARTTIAVAALPLGAAVEIDLIVQ